MMRLQRDQPVLVLDLSQPAHGDDIALLLDVRLIFEALLVCSNAVGHRWRPVLGDLPIKHVCEPFLPFQQFKCI